MICFRDRSFCSSDCVNTDCGRCFTPELRQAAAKWWEGLDGEAPVAFTDYKTGCQEYVAPGLDKAK